MSDNAFITCEAEGLRRRIQRLVLVLGAPVQVAAEVARHLVRAEQSGHASHGVLRLPQYAREIEAGLIDPTAVPADLSTTRSAIVLDARRGFGHYAAAQATESAAAAASRDGIAAATIRNCTHIGRLGDYAERLAAQGLIGLIQVGAAGPGVGSMAAFGSASGTPFLNTNPWCFSAPSSTGAVVFDGSMSTIAEGKVHAAKARGVPLPEGAILSAGGKPSVDPDDFYAGGTLTPLGGGVAGHKGYGLALAAALMGGLAHADGSAAALRGLASVRYDDGAPGTLGGVTVVVVDPGAFGAREAYAGAVGQVADALRNDGAMAPGDFERGLREKAGASVVLPQKTLAALDELEARLGALTEAAE